MNTFDTERQTEPENPEAQALQDELAILQELDRREERTKLLRYKPYNRVRGFHDGGAIHRERLLWGGNQQGKTYAGGAETAYHLTGKYPPDWKGKRFDRPIRAWAASDGYRAARDAAQRTLVGPPEDESAWGTGLIPGDDLLGWARASVGVPNLLDHVRVQHHRNVGTEAEPVYDTDGISVLSFKSYDQGRAKWQGETLDLVWFDEEPPYDVYIEGLSRTNATGGIVYCTFTPLKGFTELVQAFIDECGMPD